MSRSKAPANAILAALPAAVRKQLELKLTLVELVYNQDLYAAGGVIEHVYFPDSGMASILAEIGEDLTIEVGVIGREGMIGLPVFLGEIRSNDRVVVQGAGSAWQITAKDLLAVSDTSIEMRRILNKFAFSLMTQIAQSAACNRYHPIDARFARWLLMTRDRMLSDEFQITQEFLSNMLGVRREAVSKVASGFSGQDLISYVRGNLKIHDPAELERRACTCYGLTRADMHGAN